MGLKNKSTRFKEIVCSLVAYIPVLIGGMQAGFPAFIMPQLRREMFLTMDQMSWLASLGFISLVFGPLISMFLGEKYGRRRNLQLILFVFTIGWTVILISRTFTNLVVGATLCGFAAGTTIPLSTLYVTEISRARYRASLLSLVWLMSIIGVSLVHTLEFYFSWRRAVFVIVILTLLGSYLLNGIPESKYWYMMRGRLQDAKNSALWFENTPVVEKEVEIINGFVELNKTITESQNLNGSSMTWIAIKNLPMTPFLLAVAMSVLRCGTGKILFNVYPVNMFTDMHTPYNSVLLGVWFGFLNFLCCMANIAIFGTVDKFNRKNFFYTLTVLMVVTLTVNICVESLSDDFMKPLPGLRVFCMYVYLVIEGTGYFCVTSVMINEIIPIMQRGVGLSLSYLITNLVLAAYIKLFPMIELYVTFRGLCTYFLINVVAIAALVRKYFPETRGNLFFGTATNNMAPEGYGDGEFDKMINEDWFRNEVVQQFFTENKMFSSDAEALVKFNTQWLNRVKETMDASKSLMVSPEQQRLLAVNETRPPPLFDAKEMQKNTQLWVNNMKKWNPWMNKDFLNASNKMFKQPTWYQNPKMPTMGEPNGSEQDRRQSKTRKKSSVKKPKVDGGDEKIV